MNNNILKKCLEELAKDKPDISYVRGMLETLVELNTTTTEPLKTVQPITGNPFSPYVISNATTTTTDEGALLDAAAAAKLAKVKEIAQKSVSQ